MLEHQRNIYTVPFRLRGSPLVSIFVGRTNELQRIEEDLELGLINTSKIQRLRIAILQGLGGVGKTQLAIEYAARHQGLYTAIFWCNGKSEALLRLELARVAEQIPLNGVLDSNNKILKDELGVEKALTAVFDWLSEMHNTKWLIIIDNVDTEGAVPASYDIWKQLPRHGSILITSRLASLRRLGKGVEIREMPIQDGLQILCNATGDNVEDQGESWQPKLSHAKVHQHGVKIRKTDNSIEAAIIVERLQGLPLAIAQAGAYIYEMGITTKTYLDTYSARTRDILTQNNDITYASGSIMATLQISYDAVETRNPLAFKLLTFLGFLDNSDVWWELFHLAWKCRAGFADSESDLPDPEVVSEQSKQIDSPENKTYGWLTDLAKDESLFNKAISTLREFYFIRRNEAGDSLSLHPIVHTWLRQRLESESWHSNLNAAISVLGRGVPYAHFEESWILQRRLAAHVDFCLELVEQAKAEEIDSPEGFQGLAILMFDTSRFEAAERLYRRAGEGWERRSGFEYWQTRRAYQDMGLAYRTLGKYDEAEALWTKLLEAYIRIEGTELTQSTCRLLENLGILFTMTKRYAEAEKTFAKALAVREDLFQNGIRTAPGEPVTLDLEVGLADVCRHYGILKQAQGKLDDAESLYSRSLRIFQKQLGPNHTWTLLAISDLGNVSRARGQHETAEMFLRTALVGMEEHLGESHNYTIKTYQDLAKVLLATQRRGDAVVLFEKAAKGLEISRGVGSVAASEAWESVRNVMNMDDETSEKPTPSSQT